jgi:hypothetical protein
MRSIFRYILPGIVLSLSLAACKKNYTDPISKVDPGPDAAAPTVEIISPTGNVQYPSSQDEGSFNFIFKVEDDIEISKVEISLNGTVLQTYTEFVDYRGMTGTYTYPSLGLGNHTFQVVATDLSGKTTTKTFDFTVSKYDKILPSETLYVPFAPGGDFKDLINFVTPTVTGNPTTTNSGYVGAAYQGAIDAYLSFPIAGLFGADEFSIAFWYKLNTTPDRAGMVVVGNDNDPETRNQGFRLFRENAPQNMTVIVGTGNTDNWVALGSQSAIAGAWKFFTMTFSPTEAKVYIDGVEVASGALDNPVDLTGCTKLVLGSGGPLFSYWDHKSDLSLYDEFRVFNKALTPDEIQEIMQ